ncbi:hypothetical protein [Rhodobacter capsulatus]|uniref:hypothetical protein n=1 Tax=Rhodobacter capsulatus TaxID=1061 RepID=UPI0040270927
MTDNAPATADARFENRRKMAWRAFYALIIYSFALTIAGALSDSVTERINDLSVIVSGVYATLSSIVLTYFGVAAYTDRNDLKYAQTPTKTDYLAPAVTEEGDGTN